MKCFFRDVVVVFDAVDVSDFINPVAFVLCVVDVFDPVVVAFVNVVAAVDTLSRAVPSNSDVSYLFHSS